jgi:hypothetical protein
MSERYAARTEVSTDKSRAEIERTLMRYGADGFVYGWEGNRAMIAFRMKGRRIQFELLLPDKYDKEFLRTPSKGLLRTPEQALAAWEQACRQRWRALALYVKATLEAVEAGIVTFEDAFIAWTMLPGGASVSTWLQPQIEQAYTSGRMPPLLPGGS